MLSSSPNGSSSRERGEPVQGRIGGLTNVGRHGPAAVSAPARAAFLARFEAEADPLGVLPPEERAVRAEALRRASGG